MLNPLIIPNPKLTKPQRGLNFASGDPPDLAGLRQVRVCHEGPDPS